MDWEWVVNNQNNKYQFFNNKKKEVWIKTMSMIMMKKSIYISMNLLSLIKMQKHTNPKKDYVKEIYKVI